LQQNLNIFLSRKVWLGQGPGSRLAGPS